MKYTFYGDLLGVASAYRLGAKAAYEKLNSFYNMTFLALETLQKDDVTCDVVMFSDSLFVSGSKVERAIEDIGLLFSNLLRENLFLRGAIVEGEIAYDDARITRERFQKQLPMNDTLARASGLEKSLKGARFVVELSVAEELFKSIPQWMTHEGYDRHATMRPEKNEQLLRKICATPDSTCFEFLYYWSEGIDASEFAQKIEALENLMQMKDSSLVDHYRDTIGLVKRSGIRKEVSDNARRGHLMSL